MTKIYLPFALLLFAVTCTLGQVGELDTDFGISGLVTTDVPGSNDISNRVKVQEDGKIVLGGRCDVGSVPTMFLARYDTLGVLDADFGVGGIALSDIAYFTTFSDFCIQSDGKFLVLGNAIITPGEFDMALTRFNADGSIDTTFGTAGSIFVELEDTTNLGEAVFQLPDEKIVVLGHIGGNGTPKFVYSRFNADGSPDTDFGDGNGHMITEVTAENVIISRAFRKTGGKIAVAGFGIQTGLYNDAFVAMFKDDGSLDPSFGTGGIQWIDISTSSFYAYDVLVQPDNNILFIGTYTDDITGDTNMKVVRLKDDGAPDPAFGDGGMVTIDFDGNQETGTAIELQPDFSILVGGSSTANGNRDFVLMRLKNDGSADNLFGTDGVVFTDFTGDEDKVMDIILQDDFKILQTGQVKDGGWQIAVARFINNTEIETALDSDNSQIISLFPNPAGNTLHIKHLPAEMHSGSYQIADIAGNVIKTAAITDVAGETVIDLPAQLAPGMYIIRFIQGGECLKSRFIKQ